MASWRFLRRWSDGEISDGLADARTLPLNFDPREVRGPQRGWNLAASRALIAIETAGPPPPGGTFDRLWGAVRDFEHSDPRIVVAHFRNDEPLDGRIQLLELRALGLGYLCPSRIASPGYTEDPRRTRRWFALDTLEGHIERGREYFFLEKDHASGEIRFRIMASWRPGDFPNGWSRLGFHLMGRRYQRAWHRLAHLRLRRIAAGYQQQMFQEEGIAHRGTFLPAEPVQLFAQRGVGRRYVDVEGEGESMRSDELWTAVGLGALSGVRSMSGPSAVLRSFEERGAAPKAVAALVSAIALGELAADKLPFLPARTHPASLAGRLASGAYVGASSRLRAGGKWFPLALVGAASALAATYASYHLRRGALRRSARLGWLVAATEDAFALGASRWLVRNHFPSLGLPSGAA